jgi:hypothetical protein
VGGGSANQLRTHSHSANGTRSTCSFIKTENTRNVGGTDSPLDQTTNHNDFVAHVCSGDYITVYTDASGESLQGMPVGDLTNAAATVTTGGDGPLHRRRWHDLPALAGEGRVTGNPSGAK